MLRLGCFAALVAAAVGAWLYRAPLGRAVGRLGGREAPLAFGGVGAKSIEEAAPLKDVTVERHGDDIEVTGYF